MSNSEINTAEKTEIRNIGTVLKVDSEGNLISQSSARNIKKPWADAVQSLVNGYQDHLADDLHSFYVRGSVSRGTPIEGVSDIDALVLVHGKVSELEMDWKSGLVKKLKDKYPFCNGFDVVEKSYEEVRDGKHPVTSFNIKTQSACVYGEDFSEYLSPMKPGRESILVAWWFNQKHLDKKRVLIKQAVPGKINIRNECKWLTKHILRLGFELVMERDQTYTRDLYPSYEIFSKYYPEKQKEMRQVLELAVNFSDDREKVLEILNGVGQWVVGEAEKQLLNPEKRAGSRAACSTTFFDCAYAILLSHPRQDLSLIPRVTLRY